MKKISTLFLQMAIVLIGLGALVFLLWEPHLEGRNKHASLFEVYFQDPFLAYVYVASIPFFVGLYQAFKLLGYVRQNRVSSPATLKALRTIKYCAIIMIGFVAVSVAFMPLDDPEDRPPGIVMRVFVTFCSIVVATAAAMLERNFQTAVDMAAEQEIKA